MIRTARLAVLIVVLASALPSPADEKLWPGRSPDCWPESRMVHGAATIDPWRKNTAIARVHAEKPTPGEFSPNKGYFFVVEGGNPTARITIYAEKDRLESCPHAGCECIKKP